MTRTFCILAAAVGLELGFAGHATAQQTASPRTDAEPATSFGTVTGHVYFSGANSPARLVEVALQPIAVKLPDPYTPGKRPSLGFRLYETDLNGAFTIAGVRPGTYYVVVTVPGLLSPFAQFTPEQLAHPTPEIAQRIAGTLTAVSVQPNGTSSVDIRLSRGASLAGTITFDDGTPFLNAEVTVQRHAADGKWVSAYANGNAAVKTDVDGHWRAGGLMAGEYRVRLRLEVSDHRQDVLLGNSSSSSGRTLYAISVYSGDTTRERDAKTVTLEDNQQMSGEDIAIPASKLHSLSGAVLDARTGQPLNACRVELVYADDGTSAASATIDPETRTFFFNFVAEGEYRLKTQNAREVRYEPVTLDQYGFPEERKSATLHAYAPGELPVVVTGEMTGIDLSVSVIPDRP